MTKLGWTKSLIGLIRWGPIRIRKQRIKVRSRHSMDVVMT